MSVTTLSPTESARAAHRELQEALLKLAEAQVAVSRAIQTVAMFDRNFQLGYYTVTGTVTSPRWADAGVAGTPAGASDRPAPYSE